MSNRSYHLGLLLVVFGGFLMNGRGLFAAESGTVGLMGLMTMTLGLLTAGFSLISSSA